MIKHLDTSSVDFEESLQSVISSTSEPSKSVIETVSKIITDVRERGDDALLEYTNLMIIVRRKLNHYGLKKMILKWHQTEYLIRCNVV